MTLLLPNRPLANPIKRVTTILPTRASKRKKFVTYNTPTPVITSRWA